MRSTFRQLALIAAAVSAPALAIAQGPPRAATPGQARAVRPAGVTQILNARRALDLTPRQVAQLDSIERVVYTERRAAMARMAPMRDSVRASARTGQNREAMRDSARVRMERMRPQMEQMRLRDSTANAAAERVLTDAQRQQLRELRAEQRGRMQGMREGRGNRQERGMRPQSRRPR